MCMDRLKKFATNGRGYQILALNANGKLKNLYRTETPPELEEWRAATPRPRLLKAKLGGEYPCGFHIFTRMKDAIKYAGEERLRDRGNHVLQIYRVRFREVLATGNQTLVSTQFTDTHAIFYWAFQELPIAIARLRKILKDPVWDSRTSTDYRKQALWQMYT